MRFFDPQPKDKRERNYFGRKIRGTYVSEDKDTITIRKHDVLSNVTKFDEESKVNVYEVLELGDSCVLKKLKGMYFVNQLNESGHYDLIVLDLLKDNTLQIKYVKSSKTKINKLEKIMYSEEVLNDNGKVSYHVFTGTKKQWRKAIRKNMLWDAIRLRKLD